MTWAFATLLVAVVSSVNYEVIEDEPDTYTPHDRNPTQNPPPAKVTPETPLPPMQEPDVPYQPPERDTQKGHREHESPKRTTAPNNEQPNPQQAHKKRERVKPEPKPQPQPEPEPVTQAASPMAIGKQMAAKRGWTGHEWEALAELWHQESGWNPQARNPHSGAYGIPQALPGAKMRSVGPDWKTNPRTQMKWGMNYIEGRYGTPAAALSHYNKHNWY